MDRSGVYCTNLLYFHYPETHLSRFLFPDRRKQTPVIMKVVVAAVVVVSVFSLAHTTGVPKDEPTGSALYLQWIFCWQLSQLPSAKSGFIFLV